MIRSIIRWSRSWSSPAKWYIIVDEDVAMGTDLNHTTRGTGDFNIYTVSMAMCYYGNVFQCRHNLEKEM